MTDAIALEPALLMQSMSMIPIGRLKAGPNPRKVNADASYKAIVAGFSDADNNKAAEWLPKGY